MKHSLPNRRAASLRRSAIVALAALEPRLVFAATEPTAYEQYLLELINRGRADPAAESVRYNVALNEGLAPGTISTAAKQPLTMNGFLVTSARGHTDWMRANGVFQHEGAGGSTPTQRMQAAGYVTSGAWGTGENISVTMSSVSNINLTQQVEANYKNLFVDANYAGRGHRTNLMSPAFESVGTGVSSGSFTYNGKTWPGSVLVGQDFAYTAGTAFLTGVAYDDSVADDNFYTPGEQLAGVKIVAKSSGGATYNATTGTAGGWSLQVPDGTYTISATNSAGKVATYTNVVVSGQNVKRDFEKAQFTASSAPGAVGVVLASGTLTVTGTGGADTITATLSGDTLAIVRNGVTTNFTASSVGRVSLSGGDGNDTITLVGAVNRATIVGGAGNDSLAGGELADRIEGSDGDDYLRGGSGDDSVYGGDGDDYINGNGGKNFLYGEGDADRVNGGGGKDYVYGGAGDDRLYGGSGNDLLDGGGNVDRMYGGDGDDVLLGGTGNDRMYADAGNDTLTGGRGTDSFNGGTGTDTANDRDDIESVLEIEAFA